MPARERWSLAGLDWTFCGVGDAGAGHVITRREHLCGDFRDDFDWSSLPRAYLARIGAAAEVEP